MLSLLTLPPLHPVLSRPGDDADEEEEQYSWAQRSRDQKRALQQKHRTIERKVLGNNMQDAAAGRKGRKGGKRSGKGPGKQEQESVRMCVAWFRCCAGAAALGGVGASAFNPRRAGINTAVHTSHTTCTNALRLGRGEAAGGCGGGRRRRI